MTSGPRGPQRTVKGGLVGLGLWGDGKDRMEWRDDDEAIDFIQMEIVCVLVCVFSVSSCRLAHFKGKRSSLSQFEGKIP